MSRSGADIFVNPLFFEALSGEFTPPSDAQKRAHTLGRLAIATFIKGEQKIVNHGATTSGLTNTAYIKYSPSWAPEVTVEVIGYLTDNKGKSNESEFLLKIMSLNNQEDGDLLITNLADKGLPIMHVHGLGMEFDLALEPGDQLDIAKHKAATLAQYFFELDASQ